MPWSSVVSGTGGQLLEVLRRSVAENPLVAGAIALVVLLAFGVLWLAVRHYRRPAGARLKRALAGRESITLLLHPNPDPDAMASAMGIAHLAEEVGVETAIRYPGEIRHQENRAFRTVLALDVAAIEADSDLAGDVVLVDHNEARGFTGAGDVDPLAVVDHHPGDGTGRAFTDVRPTYGACATIVAEYLEELGYEPDTGSTDRERILPVPVATGLLYGILADTNHLSRGCSTAEFEASSFLYPGIDEDLLDRIANPEVDAEVLDVKARAIEERRKEGPFVVSYVGPVSNVDAIPQAAEELLHLEGVTAVVVMGKKDGTLHLSGRSRDDRVHMGEVLDRVVEGIPMSEAGGHARMGGGQLSIDHMNGLGPSEGVSIEEFGDRVIGAMTGDS
ncbi:MAG: bifunctional oligoribonuclease/PAP phosphatase NrnA [Halodesulfurarchaeum sp.]